MDNCKNAAAELGMQYKGRASRNGISPGCVFNTYDGISVYFNTITDILETLDPSIPSAVFSANICSTEGT